MWRARRVAARAARAEELARRERGRRGRVVARGGDGRAREVAVVHDRLVARGGWRTIFLDPLPQQPMLFVVLHLESIILKV